MGGLRRLIVVGFALLLAAAGFSAPAFAQATRTWVSGVGDDVNPCSRTAPCKTFAGAISKTAPGGEINCLDPGGFGAINITKSITIDCTGTFGSILASGTSGVIVNGAGINVILRGLSINGAPPTLPGANGIRFIQGASLTVQDVLIQNFTSTAAGSGNGISFAPSAVAELYVIDSTIVNNGSASTGAGILIQPTGLGSASVELRNVRVLNNRADALRINTTGNTGPGIAVSIEYSQFSSGVNGINVNAPAGTSTINLLVEDSTITNNSGTALLATGSANATIRAANNAIATNGTGVNATGGANIQSFGNNRLLNNTTNGAFSGSILPQS
jgi:hypothetical protein